MHGTHHRFRFEKRGDLRFLSHLDLMHGVERLCRRAAIPFRSSQGFHPAPRILYPLALPLGAEGLYEVLELELTEPLESDSLPDRLNRHAPVGLRFLSSYCLPETTVGMARRAEYLLPLAGESIEAVEAAAARLLDHSELWVPRLRPKPRQVNVRPYIRTIAVQQGSLLLDLWVTPHGSARADELIAALGVPAPAESGAVLQRLTVELHDEVYDGLPDGPPAGPPQLQPLKQRPHAVCGESNLATATWGPSPNGPVVE